MEGKTELVAMLFYERLFRLEPSLRLVFWNNVNEKCNNLLDAVLVLNASLDLFPALLPRLRELGMRYASCGILPGDYPKIVSAVLQTVAELAGPRFDQALRRAWTKLLNLVTGEMLQGATEAKAAELVLSGDILMPVVS